MLNATIPSETTVVTSSDCPMRKMWAAAIVRQLKDAHLPPTSRENELLRQQGDAWLRTGRDLHTVASMIGMDGEVIRQKYIAGEIDMDVLTRDYD